MSKLWHRVQEGNFKLLVIIELVQSGCAKILLLILQLYVKHYAVSYGDYNELNNVSTTGQIWLRIGTGGGHF
jgi:hypothetical protein